MVQTNDYGHECMYNWKGWTDIRWCSIQCTQILNVDETCKQRHFLAIKGTLTLTQRLYMMFLPIAACQHQPFRARLGEKERRKKIKNFAWAAITHFRISGASQVYFAMFSVDPGILVAYMQAFIIHTQL